MTWWINAKRCVKNNNRNSYYLLCTVQMGKTFLKILQPPICQAHFIVDNSLCFSLKLLPGHIGGHYKNTDIDLSNGESLIMAFNIVCY